jgi:Rieske Fe-S protein
MTSADKTKLDGIDNSANNYSLPKATATIRGGVELGSDTVQTVAPNALSATASRSYAVQLNSADQMVVNVPWVDTNTTYGKATSTALGLVELGSDTVQTVAANEVSATASRSYAVQLNSADQMVVNVPWVDTNTDTLQTIADDTTTNATYYPSFVTATSGAQTAKVSSSKLTWNPSSGTLTINGPLLATSKSFLIPHPTKPGMKLRYGSLEGPENGVYIRGKLKGNNKIELPDYWTKLVDPDSITVTLTPIGKHQKLYVEDIANNLVTVANDGLFAGEINCFFVVYGERVDIDKLVVETERNGN